MPGFCLPSSFREVRIHPNDKINTALGISPRRPLSGWMNRHQQKVVGYLVEENRVLKGKLCGKRIRLKDDEPRRLAVKGKALGRKLLGGVATIVTPETIVGWRRKLIAKKWGKAPAHSLLAARELLPPWEITPRSPSARPGAGAPGAASSRVRRLSHAHRPPLLNGRGLQGLEDESIHQEPDGAKHDDAHHHHVRF